MKDHYFEYHKKSSYGYALHKVITDNEGKPVDYVFIDANPAFEKITGLKVKNIINKPITKVLPGILQDDFDWISFYGELAVNNEEKFFEQYSEPLKKWFKVHVFSSEKLYFTTVFTDITPERLLANAYKKLLEYSAEYTDYQHIVDTMRAISGAAYVVLNRFESNGRDFTSVAMSGVSKNIRQAAKILGFEISAKKWPYDPKREAKIKDQKTTRFNSLHDLAENAIPKQIISLIEKTFNTGEIVIVKSTKGNTMIGDFTLIYSKGKRLINQSQVESFADMTGMLFSKLETEKELKNQKEKLLFQNIILQTQQEESIDGILCVNENNEIISFNQRFADIWGIPDEIMASKAAQNALEYVLPKLSDPDEYYKNVKHIYSQKEKKTFDEVLLKDGRILERYSAPMYGDGGHYYGRVWYFRDITERRQHEERLRNSEARLQSLFNQTHDAVFMLDFKGKHIAANRRAAEMFGYTEDEILKLSVHKLSAEPQKSMEVFRRLLDGEIVPPYERKFRKKDGSVVPVEISVELVRDKNGNPLHIQSVVRDITERTRIQEALKVERAYFEHLFQSVPAGVVLLDKNDRVVGLNKGFEHLFLYSQEEAVGKFVNDLIVPDNLKEEGLDATKRVASKETIYFETIRKRKDGQLMYVAITGKPLIKDTGKLAVIGVYQDITHRKNAEIRLQNNEARMRAISESANDAIVMIDQNGRVLLWNRAAEKIFGYSKDEMLGKNLHYTIAPKKYHIAYEQGFKHFQATGDGNAIGKTLELSGQHKNGKEILIELSLSALQIDGQWHSVGIMRDITERKKAEQELIRAREQAQAASKAKSEFLANMSHEIRTPLNGVIGFTDLLKNTKLDNTQKQYLENANVSAHLLLGIINDILDFSKIEAGKLELDPVKTDVIELTGQTVDIIKQQASAKGLELLLNIQHDLPRFAMIDPVRLKQVLVNLLNNAVKFTEKGEIELKLTFSPNKRKSGTFSYSIRDTGIGIEKQKQSQLFKPFFQVDSSTTRKYGGTGLGLQISKLIINKMGGNIDLVSEPGKGSTFFFSIETLFERGERLDETSIKDIKHVLVIDDNENNRIILSQTLKNWGIDCTYVDSGIKALNLIKNFPETYDLVIVDYQMPVLDGLETIRMIRQNLNLTADKQPLVLLYGSVDDQTIHDECKQLDVSFKLVKPVKSRELFYYLKNIHQHKTAIIEPDSQQENVQQKTAFCEEALVLLIVEDVQMNMELMRSVLDSILPNAKLIEASNGNQAVEIITGGEKIDIIFMDIQMPVMDGLEATRLIRDYEKSIGSHTPIIALTAGVVKGEKERCINAGMDDFLSKPLNHKMLVQILQQYISVGKKDPFDNGHKSTEKDEQFDLDGLLDRTGASEEIMMPLAKKALLSILGYLERLKQAVTESNIREVEFLIHSIKGLSQNMGFLHMEQLALNAESLIVNAPEKLPGIVDELFDRYQSLEDMFAQEYPD